MPKKHTLKRIGKILILFGLLFFCVVLLPLIGVIRECRPFGEPVLPQTQPLPAETSDLADYARLEDQTYLTLPEWYIVYSADEYGAFIAANQPSQFPYFRAIAQYWRSYYDVCAITRDKYPFNSGYHLTLVVIGTSFTVENIVKGLYESTLGRLAEWLSFDEPIPNSNGALTEEELYARQVAKEYGDFIHTIPWYVFPFDEKLRGLWNETSWWGPNPLRKWERKISLSAEYGIKTLYGRLIGQGTQATYVPENLEIQAWTQGVTEEVLATHPEVHIIKSISADTAITAIPRYEAFTNIVPQLTSQGVQFIEIAGNDEILITAITPRDWTYTLAEGELLLTMEILTQPAQQRVAVKAPVAMLHTILAGLAETGATLEHVYDY